MKYRLNKKPMKAMFAVSKDLNTGLCRKMVLRNAQVYWHPIRMKAQVRMVCPFNRKRSTVAEMGRLVIESPYVAAFEAVHQMREKMCCACDDRLLYNTEALMGGARRAGMKYALKKAEINRPMTIEELQAADDQSYVWIEVRGNACQRMRAAWAKCGKVEVRSIFGRAIENSQTMFLYLSAYGCLWRCWRKEPTGTEREKTPWEDEGADEET